MNTADWPIVPGYDVLGELGRGGMGVVYKARRHAPEAVVALKALLPDALRNQNIVDRFQREMHAVTALRHPNIVRAFGTEQAEGRHFLVMEYVEGVNLHRLVEGDLRTSVPGCGRLPVALACDYIRQAALGLQHVFDTGLVHRDVKPSNLILAPAPLPGEYPLPGGLVRLLDLGLVRLHPVTGPGPRPAASALSASLHNPDGTLTPDGMVLGSLDFIAPEQAEKPREADIRSDLYALGCTLYYLLTGEVPFPAASKLEKLHKHRYADPPSLRHKRLDVPPAVAEIVARLMEKRPGDRYQTPDDLARVLQPFGAEEALGVRTTFALAVPAFPVAESTDATDAFVGETRQFTGHEERVAGIAVAADGQTFLSAGWDGSVRRWDVDTGLELGRFDHPERSVNCVGVSPDGAWALSGTTEGVVRLWDVETRRELLRLTGHDEPVTAVAFLPGGRHALSAGLDGTLRLWDLQTGREERRLTGHTKCVNTAAVSPDGRRVLSGGGTPHHRDYDLRLWDVESGKELTRFTGHYDAVCCVTFSADGRRALSGGWDQVLRLWNVESGREMGRFEGHRHLVWGVALSPDGRRALSGSRDRTLRWWDVASGDDLRCFERHSGWVTCVAFLPDGRRALSGSTDATIRLWHLPD